MLQSDAASQLSFLVTICFSFSIFACAACFKRAGLLPRLLGFAFFTPFILYAASFLSHSSTIADSLITLTEPALLLFIAILLAAKPAQRHYGLLVFSLLTTPFILLLICSNSVYIQQHLSKPLSGLLSIVILLLLNMYLLKSEKGTKSLLFWAVLTLSAAAIAGKYENNGFPEYITTIMRLTAFSIFAAYFYNEFFESFIASITKSEKQASDINRSLKREVNKRVFEIERVNKNLVNIAKTDALSKAFNKAAVFDVIDSLILKKPQTTFAVLMFDIDNFKNINDSMGHVEGDKCIKLLSMLARNNFRDFDIIGRYGGDEFIIVLPETSLQHSLHIAERFRKKVAETTRPSFTISIGISMFPKDGSTVDDMVKAADEGLYKSKSRGKNTISYNGD